MKKTIIALPIIALSSVVYADIQESEMERLVLSLKQNAQSSSSELISNPANLDYGRDLKIIRVPKNEVEATIERLNMDSIVENVEIDPIVKNPYFFGRQDISGGNNYTNQNSSDTPSDPELKNQFSWMPRTESQPGHMDILKGFQKSNPKKEIRIGIIDAGFYLDSDIDWEQGYNFSTKNGDRTGPEYLEDYYDENCSSAHGSAVAQVIGAKTDNYQGIAGAVKAKIYPVRSMSCGSGYLVDTAIAIRWLAQDKSVDASITIDKPVDIINMSLGGGNGCTSYMQNAINYAYNKGIAIFTSAGNESKDVERVAPAGCENVFVVGSVGTSGKQSHFTNYGDGVDASALGEKVRSYDKNGFKYWYGTSFASPNAVAIAALALQANPSMTVDELYNYLKSGAYKFQPGAISNKLGAGIINASLIMDSVNKDIGANKPTLNTILSSKSRTKKAAYQDATFIDDSGDIINTCSIFEIDASRYETPVGYPNKTLFSVPQGQPLTLNSASQVSSSIEPKFIEYHLNPDQYDYALGYCDSSGSSCSEDDFIKLEDDKINKESWCES